VEVRAAKRHPLSKREVRHLLKEVEERLGEPPFTRSPRIELVELAEPRRLDIYLVDGLPCLARLRDGTLIPLIICLQSRGSGWLRGRVTADKGATMALARGAHLMIPGVRGVEGDFKEGDVVVVLYYETRAPVMVGVAELDSRGLALAAREKRRGRAVRRLHYVGDALWEASRVLAARG